MSDFISYKDMAKLFIEAEEQFFVGDIESYDDCNSKCDSCSARPACLTLSVNRTELQYGRELYYDFVLPIIEELKNESRCKKRTGERR